MIGKSMCFLKLLFQILFTKKKIIELIIKIQSNRYQTFKEYVFFNHGFGKKLCYKDVFLSDHDIDLANGYSKWRYPSNNVLFINSNEATKKNEPVSLQTNCKIMYLVTSSIQQKKILTTYNGNMAVRFWVSN